MIIVMGQIHVEPSEADRFLADVKAIVPETSDGAGCLFYRVALEDAATGRMLVAERWANDDALLAHLQRPEVAAFVEKWGGVMKADVRKYDASNERPLAN
jgi:quinol monooxygenase YgiN